MTAMTMSAQNGTPPAIQKVLWNEEILAALRSIDQNELIALFTPIVPQYRGPALQPGEECPEDMDPFECFGRALSRYHWRIQHVPYVPREGFTREHSYWVSKSAGVIVVNCEPYGNDYDACWESYLEQQDFVATTADAVEHLAETIGWRPVAFVKCGTDWTSEVDDRNVFIKCPDYSAHSLQQAAWVLFNDDS